MKKETLIIIFYILYFSWLLTVTYLSPETIYLNFFTLIIFTFYAVFLKEEWDTLYFIAAVALGAYLSRAIFSSLKVDSLKYLLNNVSFWIPLAWGTTILALRKFYLIMTR